ncbi:MAG: hypothetical protein IBX72_05915 [Nitrospirae bacterium]|nr:hypothetical protein [Nitrospirota bacterium]
MKFFEYELKADRLCMGERVKGGLLRPCCRTIRYSQITGALKEYLGSDQIHAVGHLITDNEHNIADSLIYSPGDRFRSVSKIPLQIEFLTNVWGKVYILKNQVTERLFEPLNRFEIFMGAFRSKGFGKCALRRIDEVDTEDIPSDENGKNIPGFLNTRIPIKPENNEEYEEFIQTANPTRFLTEKFGIREIIEPKLGYLFEPDERRVSGRYVLAVFEKSKIIGPRFLI